jgi:hypothetical protein
MGKMIFVISLSSHFLSVFQYHLCTGLIPIEVAKFGVKATINSIVLLSFHKMTVIHKKKTLDN